MNPSGGPRGPGERLALAWLVLVYVFLFAPLAVVALMSFNASPYGTLPFTFTVHWYRVLVAQPGLIAATGLSVELSLGVALASVVLGAMAALAMVRYGGAWVRAVTVAFAATVTVPWIILAIGMNLVLSVIGLGNSMFALYVGDLALSLPYAALILVARLSQMNPELEQAARSLGATPWRTFWAVTAPLSLPGLLAAGLMAFVVCFNNFVVQYFLAPFGVQTLPLDVYNAVRVGYSPDIDALSALLALAAVVLVVLVQRLGAMRDVMGVRAR